MSRARDIADGTFTDVDVDNIKIDGNTISSTNTNGGILITPNGSGNVGIGTGTPECLLDVRTAGETEQVVAEFSSTGDGSDRQRLSIIIDPSTQTTDLYSGSGGGSDNDTNLAFSIRDGTNGRTERMRIDTSGNVRADKFTDLAGTGAPDFPKGQTVSSGNVLIGKTANDATTAGLNLTDGGVVIAVKDGGATCIFNRLNSDGEVVDIRKDGTTVGSIGTNPNNGSFSLRGTGTVSIGRSDNNTSLVIGNQTINPGGTDGLFRDNVIDLGLSSARYDDVYATNSLIQTSDKNEKQDIEELSEAEQRVAIAAKGLLRKYRWKSAVAEKGDEARIHFGIIAQDLKAAFEAEGLDAGRYGMFIHSEWWEAEEIYTDDDGAEKTRINTFDSEAEAPEGAVKKDRMGIRYSELLAFIISAI